jgi:hypothetical protein
MAATFQWKQQRPSEADFEPGTVARGPAQNVTLKQNSVGRTLRG